MWEYEYSLETDVNRDDLWHQWADIASWPTWNDGIARVAVDGPFAVGTTFTMTPPHGEPIPMRLTEIDPGTVFTDEMDDGQTRVTTLHRLDTTRTGAPESATGPRSPDQPPSRSGPRSRPTSPPSSPPSSNALRGDHIT